MVDPPVWIRPGDAATLIWYSGRGEGADGARLCRVAGPALEHPPRSPYFLLAPVEESHFAHRLYTAQATLPVLRSFLGGCTLAEGALDPSLDFLATRRETPVLPLLEAWGRAAGPPVLPYLAAIDAFLLEGRPVFMTGEAHAVARREREALQTAWVCEECGEAEDASVFMWTTRGDGRVRVALLIQNDAGVWTCRLHPFEFRTEA